MSEIIPEYFLKTTGAYVGTRQIDFGTKIAAPHFYKALQQFLGIYTIGQIFPSSLYQLNRDDLEQIVEVTDWQTIYAQVQDKIRAIFLPKDWGEQSGERSFTITARDLIPDFFTHGQILFLDELLMCEYDKKRNKIFREFGLGFAE
jgi:hypothetical protein